MYSKGTHSEGQIIYRTIVRSNFLIEQKYQNFQLTSVCCGEILFHEPDSAPSTCILINVLGKADHSFEAFVE